MRRCASGFTFAGRAALLLALTVIGLHTLAGSPARADYELPDEGLPQMQPTGLEAVPDDASDSSMLIDQISIEDQAAAALQDRPLASRELWDGSYDQLAVRGLDDPQNYWAGQYTDYDRWLFEHYFPHLKEKHIYNEIKAELLTQSGAGEQDWVYVVVEVDKAGFMLPSAQTWERKRAPLPAEPLSEVLTRSGYRSLEYEQLWQMPCAGVMPADMRARMEHDRALQLAADYPAIPQWLGLNPCAWVIFLPGDQLLCSGEPGSYQSLQRLTDDPQNFKPAYPESWQRFSIDGQPLGAIDPQSPELRSRSLSSRFDPSLTYTTETSPGMNPDEYDLRSEWFRARMRREVDPETGRKVARPLYVNDLQGNPLDLDAPLDPLVRNYYRQVDGAFIHWLYQAQLELGLTSGDPGPEGC